MKKIFLFLLFTFLLFPLGMMAQKHCMNKQEFRNRQQAFLTERANLTAEEARQFFPLYFELQDKKEIKNREAWQQIKKGKETLTEGEYDKINEEVVKCRLESCQLEQEYLQKYKKILPAKKIFDLQRAELRFHRELLKPRKSNK